MKLGFKQRLNKIVATQKSLAGFARKAGIPQPVMFKYVHGESMPGTVNLVAIAKAAGISVKWLATGEGTESDGIPTHVENNTGSINQVVMCKAIEKLRIDLRAMNMQMLELSDDDLSKLLIVYYDGTLEFAGDDQGEASA